MITLACPECGKKLKVQDELLGKKVKCPGCGKAVVAPGAGVGRMAALAESGKVSPAPGSRPADDSAPPTLPPAPPSVDSSDEETAGDARKAAGGHPPELTAFLAPPQAPDEIGRLGPYRVLAVLGHGGMGVVFRAQDPHLERLVALKAMLPALAGSPSARERFFREAKAAAALKHPHIVTIFQVGEDRGAPFLAMEFLEGESLDERLKREGRLPVPEVLRIGREVARGLAAAHERGLVHRDVKPANIWLETQAGDPAVGVPPSGSSGSPPEGGTPTAAGGHVKILDFGLARSLADQTHLTQSGAIVGTPAYMAPEQASGRPVDPRCDLFSLGGVLYRMATGELPFKGSDTMAILRALELQTPKPPRETNPEVPEALSELVLRLLAKKPEERPESARVVVQALQALQDLEGQATMVQARPAPSTQEANSSTTARMEVVLQPSPQPAKPRSRRSWLVAAAAGGILLLGLVVLLFSWGFGHRPPLADQPQVSENIDHGKEGQQDKGKEVARSEDPAKVEPGPVSWNTSKPGAVSTNSLGMMFAFVPRGRFWMGGGGGKAGDKEVEIPHDFFLGVYEVTQKEWQDLMGDNPSGFSRGGEGKGSVKDIPDAELAQFPVENVDWEMVQDYLEKLNAKEKDSGWKYRLPTSAEWEYACRGGPTSKQECSFDYYFAEPTNDLSSDDANFNGDGPAGTGAKGKWLRRPTRVGAYKPNRLGLYDMHGNVWEWCDDSEGALNRVDRGGSWRDLSAGSRAAERYALAPSTRINNLGVRLARVPVGTQGK